MLHFSKSVLIKKQTHLHLGGPESELIFIFELTISYIFSFIVYFNIYNIIKQFICMLPHVKQFKYYIKQSSSTFED